MSGHASGLRWFLAVLSCTLVICDDSNIGSLIDEVFGSPNGGDGGRNAGEGGNNLDTNGDNVRGNEQVVGGTPDNNAEGTNLGGDQCTCVPYYLCANNSIITDGTGLLDIRIPVGTCENYMDVCCGEPLTPENAITPKPHGRLGCGKRNIDGVGFRITGNVDNEAQFGEFPWMIAILKEDLLEDGSKLNIYQCGGSLIHEQVVLTAAHCVIGKEASSLKVRAGEWDTQTKNELYAHQDRLVAQIITHEKYYSGALYNDVALLILRDPIDFADNVDIVCLPLQGDVVLNKECFASGWGKDIFDEEIVKTDGIPPPGNDGDLNVRFLSGRNDVPKTKPRHTTMTLAKRLLRSLQHQRQERQTPFIPEFLQQPQQQQQQNQKGFLGGIFQGFQQQPIQQKQPPNFLSGLLHGFQQNQHQHLQKDFNGGFFQGLQQQQNQQREQQHNFAEGFLHGIQQQREQQHNFAEEFQHGVQQQRNQQREQQHNFAQGLRNNLEQFKEQLRTEKQNLAGTLLHGLQTVIEKKTEFIKSTTDEFIKKFNRTTETLPENTNNAALTTIAPYSSMTEFGHTALNTTSAITFAPPTISIFPSATPTVPGKEGHYQVILKKVELPMVPRDQCVAELRKTRLGPYFRLHDSFVCAGGIPGKDTCKGDGGSPLVCPIPGRDYQYQQVGIVAWGIGCGNVTPAVYVNVAQFRDWIDSHLKKLNFKFEYNY